MAHHNNVQALRPGHCPLQSLPGDSGLIRDICSFLPTTDLATLATTSRHGRAVLASGKTCVLIVRSQLASLRASLAWLGRPARCPTCRCGCEMPVTMHPVNRSTQTAACCLGTLSRFGKIQADHMRAAVPAPAVAELSAGIEGLLAPLVNDRLTWLRLSLPLRAARTWYRNICGAVADLLVQAAVDPRLFHQSSELMEIWWRRQLDATEAAVLQFGSAPVVLDDDDLVTSCVVESSYLAMARAARHVRAIVAWHVNSRLAVYEVLPASAQVALIAPAHEDACAALVGHPTLVCFDCDDDCVSDSRLMLAAAQRLLQQTPRLRVLTLPALADSARLDPFLRFLVHWQRPKLASATTATPGGGMATQDTVAIWWHPALRAAVSFADYCQVWLQQSRLSLLDCYLRFTSAELMFLAGIVRTAPVHPAFEWDELLNEFHDQRALLPKRRLADVECLAALAELEDAIQSRIDHAD